jgi:DNA-binding NarL/FixJ family response regulator
VRCVRSAPWWKRRSNISTTRNHLSTIMQKLDAHSRIEAIRVAEERGWL